jgi:hypothetical protein
MNVHLELQDPDHSPGPPAEPKLRTCEIIDEGLLAILCVAPVDVLPSGLSAGRNRQRQSLKDCEARAEGTRIGFAAPPHRKSATEIGSRSPARGDFVSDCH